MVESPEEPVALSSETKGFFNFKGYCFKPADSPEELDQIYRLLYRTFVQELRQYHDSGTGYHIDKFHQKNKYIVAKRDAHVCGMVAVHDQPPFSAGDALPSQEILEKLRPKLLETRLLAVEAEERNGSVFAGLMWSVYHYTLCNGYRYLVISGLRERLKMYTRMGFRPLGDPVRRGQAYFVPMLLDVEILSEHVRHALERLGTKMGARTSR